MLISRTLLEIFSNSWKARWKERNFTDTKATVPQQTKGRIISNVGALRWSNKSETAWKPQKKCFQEGISPYLVNRAIKYVRNTSSRSLSCLRHDALSSERMYNTWPRLEDENVGAQNIEKCLKSLHFISSFLSWIVKGPCFYTQLQKHSRNILKYRS